MILPLINDHFLIRCAALITGPIGDKIGRKKVIQILTIGVFLIPVLIQSLLQFISMSINTK